MAWYVIGRDDPDLLDTLNMIGVPSDTVVITKPRSLTGICFPKERTRDVLLALGYDPSGTTIETHPTNKENFVFIIPRGETTVDTMVPQFRSFLERYARAHQMPVSYVIGSVPSVPPPGLLIVENTHGVKTPFHLFGRTWSLRMGESNPLRLTLCDTSGKPYAEVVPGAVILLIGVSDIAESAEGEILLSLILDNAVPHAFDPTLPETLEELRRQEEAREAERQRQIIEERRRREEAERRRKEEEAQREVEEARRAQIELEARRAQMGPDARKRWVAICMKRRRGTIADMEKKTEAAFKVIQKAACEVVQIGWEREMLRAKASALCVAREHCIRMAREMLAELAAHPQIAKTGINEATGEVVLTTRPIPPESPHAKVWSIRMGDVAPRVVLAPESGGDKNADTLVNDEQVYPAFLKFAANRDYVNAANVVIEYLMEGGSNAEVV